MVLELIISDYILRKDIAIPDDLNSEILILAAVYGLTDIGNGCKIMLKLKPLYFRKSSNTFYKGGTDIKCSILSQDVVVTS